ncbi:MAG: hypothetical protein AAFX79_13510 [Planctomycetota bacterium]
MATSTQARTPQRTHQQSKGVWVDRIAGSYRPIAVHQLAMAWWCYHARHITRRQFRIYFAAHEMHERRRCGGSAAKGTRPLYTTAELRALVGGRGSPSADRELEADARRLARLGLVSLGEHAIDFATSIGDLAIEDATDFDDMLERLPHPRRTVPVPRRIVRAIAGAFSRGAAAVAIATLIRSLFWHKGQGRYRVDGRTTREWITDVFGISPRTVTEGRAQLVALGWLRPLETPQHLLNRYGAHDAIDTEWTMPRDDAAHVPVDSSVDKAVEDSMEQGQDGGRSASPTGSIQCGSASPDLNRSLPLARNQATRRPARERAGRPGASLGSAGTGRRTLRGRASDAPNIRNIRPEDLRDIDRLRSLHEQALKLDLARASDTERLDFHEFAAMAERAKTHGERAGALFYWLLRERKTAFITQAEEHSALARLKEHRYGSQKRRGSHEGPTAGGAGAAPDSGSMSDEERFVVACIRVAKQQRIEDPFLVAREGRGWSREAWDEACFAFQQSQLDRQRAVEGERWI